MIPGGNGSLLASTQKRLSASKLKTKPTPHAGKEEADEVKGVKNTAPDEAPARTKTYKDLVLEYNKLQSQLDAFELVQVDKAEASSSAREEARLNC